MTSGLLGDLRVSARRLLATPLFTVFAMLSLAAGVGVTTTVYSIVESIFLKDSGVPRTEQIVFVATPFDGRLLKGSVSEPDFRDLRAAQTSFSSISAFAPFLPAVTSLATTEILAAEAVDSAYFATLGIPAAIGRTIQPTDSGGARVAVLSHVLWRARFGADPHVVGQTVRISGHPFVVIGVAAPSFEGASGLIPGTRLWIPLGSETGLAPAAPGLGSPRDRRRLLVFGRLAPSVTVAAASTELAAIARRLDDAFPAPRRGAASERPWRAKTLDAILAYDNTMRRFGLTLVGLVGLVLVVACTNLANLVLARGTTRQHEITVRYALGASRWRLVREQCVESLLLATGGAAGAYVVFAGLRVLLSSEFALTMPMGERWVLLVRPELNAAAIWLAAGALLVSLVVFGLEPALTLTRSRDIRGGLASTGGGLTRTGRQQTLVRWQVAIAAGFFIVATMFVKYTIEEARHDSGIAIEHIGVAGLNFGAQQWDERRVRRTVELVIDEARKDPALESTAVSTGLPFGVTGGIRLKLSVAEAATFDSGAAHAAAAIAATPSIFRTIGAPIVRGRGFDDRDVSGAPPVVVLSEFTARRIFGTSEAVGRQLRLGTNASADPLATVIGIARDTDVGRLLGEPRPFVYLPLSQRYDPFLTIVARANGDAPLAVRALRDAIRRAEPDVAIDVIGTGRSVLSGPYVLLRPAGLAALALGMLTLLLAMVGLFGIQSHIVSHRTREIGVRMSFGATKAQIERMVLKDGCRPVFEGLLIGLVIGLAGRASVRAYLEVEMPIIDPWMVVGVPIPLVIAAFCACYLPAHRASAVEPSVALRHI